MTALIWCPFPDEDQARQIGNVLLDEKLVGCVNILPAIHSIFEWGDERGNANEVGVLFKTSGELLEAAVTRIEALHPYQSPAILGWPCPVSNAKTEAWLEQFGAARTGNE